MKAKSIFDTCNKCKQTILKSEKTSHKCKSVPYARNTKGKPDKINDPYTLISKFFSYKIIPEYGIKYTAKIMEKLLSDIQNATARTIPEEIYIILNDAQKPMTTQAIVSNINSRFGFPTRKHQEVESALSNHKNPFLSHDGYNMWIIKSWMAQA